MTINLSDLFYFIYPPILQGIMTGLTITVMANLNMFPAVAFIIKEESIDN